MLGGSATGLRRSPRAATGIVKETEAGARVRSHPEDSRAGVPRAYISSRLGAVASVPIASWRTVGIWTNSAATAAPGYVLWAGAAFPLSPQGLVVWQALVSEEEPCASFSMRGTGRDEDKPCGS